MHFVHRALRLAGRQDRVVDNIRRRWVDLLAQGADDVARNLAADTNYQPVSRLVGYADV